MLNNIVTLKSGLKITQDHYTGTVRKLGCGFLIAFHSYYGSILHQFRDKARYWSKIGAFFVPPSIRRFRLGGGVPSVYCHHDWYKNTRMVGIPDSENTLSVISYTIYSARANFVIKRNRRRDQTRC